ncbi:ankyrin repeat domain-containing protein [Endozoicomonas sp. ONNA2]|uniref:ankyrin repeat domain-containing protein n=1 Tax=Endozoicomonas sp. ONNA2 TaxID=2828741 RepID=UPI00214727A8|nr:ankyrin repeat domain-containing protein [Endozoicomonas sp. ONNA2]
MSPGDGRSLSFGVGQDGEASTHLRHKLILAIRNFDLATVCAMLDQGADANGRYNGNSSLLHYAVRSGHSGMVDAPLSHGADPNARDSNGYRPLWIAVEDGHVQIAEL